MVDFKRLFFLITLSVSFVLAACKKEASVRGRILNKHTGVGLEDVSMKLATARNSTDNGTNWIYQTSGKDGYFNIQNKVRKKEVGKLIIDLDTTKYHLFFDQKIDLGSLSETIKLDLEVLRKKQIEFLIKNNSGYSDIQIIRVQLKFTHELLGEIANYERKIVFDNFYYNYFGGSKIFNFTEGKVTAKGTYSVDNGPETPINQTVIIQGESSQTQIWGLGI